MKTVTDSGEQSVKPVESYRESLNLRVRMTLHSPLRKRARTTLTEEGNEIVISEDGMEGEDSNSVDLVTKKTTIVIEHCKQHPAIHKTAMLMKKALEEGVDGITLLVNPEKPRKSCFEIREHDGEKFVSLLNMMQPSTQMKNLDVERVISDIIAKIKEKIVLSKDGMKGEDLNSVDQMMKKRTIVMEYCKQQPTIKTMAMRVQKALEEGVDGITLLVNPEKPRKGCFEIRENGGEKFVSLLNMKRPSTQLKNLDVEKVISDIISKFKG